MENSPNPNFVGSPNIEPQSSDEKKEKIILNGNQSLELTFYLLPGQE